MTEIAANALVEGQAIGRTSAARQLLALSGLLVREETSQGEKYRLAAAHSMPGLPTHEGALTHAP